MKKKLCKRCKTPFPPANEQSLYCGGACRQAAARERKQCPKCGHHLVESPKYKRTPAAPVGG